jgi:hypothetical protein
MDEITGSLLLSVKPQYDNHRDDYWFWQKLHNIAKENIGLDPETMPFYYRHLFNKDIASHEVIAKEIMESTLFKCDGSPNCTIKEYVNARVWQFYSAFLRELDAIYQFKKLDPGCRLYYDEELDTGNGAIDLVYDRSRDSARLCFAVRHEGTDTTYEARKNTKLGVDVIVLMAPRSKEHRWNLDTVPEETIRKYI